MLEDLVILLCFAAHQAPLAMLLAGPPCSLWIFISSSFHQRSELNNFYGCQECGSMRHANQLVVNLLVLLCIAHSRFVLYMSLEAK